MNGFPLPRAAICRSWCGDKAVGETPAFLGIHTSGRSIFIRRERAQARGCIRVRRIITRFALCFMVRKTCLRAVADPPHRSPITDQMNLSDFRLLFKRFTRGALYGPFSYVWEIVGRGRGGPDEKYKRSLRLSLLKSRAVKHGDSSVTRQASARRTVLVHRGCHRGCHRPSAGCSYTSLRRTRCSPKPM